MLRPVGADGLVDGGGSVVSHVDGYGGRRDGERVNGGADIVREAWQGQEARPRAASRRILRLKHDDPAAGLGDRNRQDRALCALAQRH